MKRVGKILVFLVVAAFITDWFSWREPEWESSYDSSLLSRGEVLDIAEQLFVYQIKQGIEAHGKTPEGYYLHLFNGQFEAEFFERFSNRNFPKLKGRYPQKPHVQFASIDIVRFEQIDKHRLTVIFSDRFRGVDRRGREAFFEKRAGQWRYLHNL